MTGKPISQEKFVCLTCYAAFDASDLGKPNTTPLDPTYRGRALRCPECGGEKFDLPKGDKPAD